MLNPTDQPQTIYTVSFETIPPIYRDTITAHCEPVGDTDYVGGKEEQTKATPNRRACRVASPQSLPSHLDDLYERTIPCLDQLQKNEVAVLLTEFSDVFASSTDDLGRTSLVKLTINTGDSKQIGQNPRRLPLSQRTVSKVEVEKMLQRGVIEHSTSPWAAPVVLVRKKDGSTRFCVDYRRLNSMTVKDSYPLPRVDDSIDALSGSCWFSTLDLASGYWKVEVEEKDRPKTAFTTGSGLYQFTVMPFGL